MRSSEPSRSQELADLIHARLCTVADPRNTHLDIDRAEALPDPSGVWSVLAHTDHHVDDPVTGHTIDCTELVIVVDHDTTPDFVNSLVAFITEHRARHQA